MKKIGRLKFYNFDEVFGKWAHLKSFQKAYEKERARLKLVRQKIKFKSEENLEAKPPSHQRRLRLTENYLE